MKAMIFAAGLGTRLAPLTGSIPKALVPVSGVPMIELLIRKLIREGFSEVIINVHHLAGQIIDFLGEKKNFGIRIEISHEEDLLLDTGGGLKKAAWFFDDGKPFLLHNVDVLSDINIQQLVSVNSEMDELATLAVSERQSSRYFLFDSTGRLCGWENLGTNQRIIAVTGTGNLQRLAFSGIHIINPLIFKLMNEEGRFSLVDTYLRLATGYRIGCIIHNASDWIDMGRPEDVVKASSLIRDGRLGNL